MIIIWKYVICIIIKKDIKNICKKNRKNNAKELEIKVIDCCKKKIGKKKYFN